MENDSDLKPLRERMLKQLTDNAANYKSFSPIERLRYAHETMQCVKDYCCCLWGLDNQTIQTFFCQGRPVTGMSSNQGAIALSIPYVLSSSSPHAIFKTCFHEMRHIYQYKVADKDDPELMSNYTGNFSKLLWRSSNSEIGADNFAYSQLLGLEKMGLIKSGERVSPLIFAKTMGDSVSNFSTHTAYKGLYKLSKLFKDNPNERMVTDKVATPNNAAPLQVFSMRELELIASVNREVFNKRNEGFSSTKNASENDKQVVSACAKYWGKFKSKDKSSARVVVGAKFVKTKDSFGSHGENGLGAEEENVSIFYPNASEGFVKDNLNNPSLKQEIDKGLDEHLEENSAPFNQNVDENNDVSEGVIKPETSLEENSLTSLNGENGTKFCENRANEGTLQKETEENTQINTEIVKPETPVCSGVDDICLEQ